jgi:hypothetical protein
LERLRIQQRRFDEKPAIQVLDQVRLPGRAWLHGFEYYRRRNPDAACATGCETANLEAKMKLRNTTPGFLNLLTLLLAPPSNRSRTYRASQRFTGPNRRISVKEVTGTAQLHKSTLMIATGSPSMPRFCAPRTFGSM